MNKEPLQKVDLQMHIEKQTALPTEELWTCELLRGDKMPEPGLKELTLFTQLPCDSLIQGSEWGEKGIEDTHLCTFAKFH